MSVDTVAERLAGEWKFNAVHPRPTSLKYLVAKYRGRFDELDASLRDGVLTGSVKVASVNVKESNPIGHLQSPDFFDAEQHPEISFTSEVLDIDGDTLTLDGQLTMKGVTAPVHATGTVNGRPRTSWATPASASRWRQAQPHRFGVSWNADLPRVARPSPTRPPSPSSWSFGRA